MCHTNNQPKQNPILKLRWGFMLSKGFRIKPPSFLMAVLHFSWLLPMLDLNPL
ncbi:hypothetical protein [Moraxella lacunata]|uniref:hypothetical protein n=1 Tax=Moraxella lacunata TaxID=477 RepID=UPI003EE107C9